jgi:hypothetical protein
MVLAEIRRTYETAFVRHRTNASTRLFGSTAIVRAMVLGPPSAEDEEADRNLGQALREGRTETLRAFAVLAVLLQAAVLAVSLGAMLVGFRGQRLVGGALIVAGLLGFGVVIAVYRRFRPRTGT